MSAPGPVSLQPEQRAHIAPTPSAHAFKLSPSHRAALLGRRFVADEAPAPTHDAGEQTQQSEVHDDDADDLQDVQLDEEAQAMLAGLVASRMRSQHEAAAGRQQQEGFTSELHDLQDEVWRLELACEMDRLQRQLQSLQGLEREIDAAEAILNATEPDPDSSTGPPAAPAQQQPGPAAAPQSPSPPCTPEEPSGPGQQEAEDEDEEYDPEAISEMQEKLDEELEQLYAQLQAVKEQAAAVAAHKAKLQAELSFLLEQKGEEEGAEEEAGEAEAGGDHGQVTLQH